MALFLNSPAVRLGVFLNALNIRIIKVDKVNQSDGQEEGPSFSKRSGARELHNLV